MFSVFACSHAKECKCERVGESKRGMTASVRGGVDADASEGEANGAGQGVSA